MVVKKEISGITFIHDRKASSQEEVWAEAKEFHARRRKLEGMVSVLRPKVEFKFNFDEPVRLIPISDLHLFTPESDYGKVEQILEELKDPHTFGFISGDAIEGANPRIAGHIGTVELPLGMQIAIMKEKIRPLVETGKILCLVGVFDGHEGWGERIMGLDLVQNMANDLKSPDGEPLKVVYNGGKLVAHLADKSTYTQLLYHDPGGGGSDVINPLGAQRMRLWEHRKMVKINGVSGGHQHHRAGVSKEIALDRRSGQESTATLFAAGTTKGTDPEYPDKFLVAMGKGPSLEPGVSAIIHQRKREGNGHGENIWPSYGYNKGEILYDAAQVWDMAERQKATDELLGIIGRRTSKPKAEFDRRNSRTHTKDDGSKTPYFETFKWNIDNAKLPVLVWLLANARYGSFSNERDREKLLQVINRAAQNPYEYVLVLRHFIDSNAAKDFLREGVLGQMANDLKGVHDKNRLLGIMMSATLRAPRWTKDVIKRTERWDFHKQKYVVDKHVEEGFYPGDYLYRESAVKKTPLYLNDAIMLLDFGQTEYSVEILDHLARSGTEFDPFRGLVQARRKTLTPVDIVTGGHMPGAGYMEIPGAVFVSPGWFSDFDSEGKSNIKRAPLGGQAVILFPDRKLIVPAATMLEATDLHTALTLSEGLLKREKKKLMNRRKR